jgi:site-specific DNA-methyltransferase (adenine-specific)
MNHAWDYDVPTTETWVEALRVLRPGGYLLAFAGTRTQHRMAVRIEDGGFEIRDVIAWVYAQGMPKSGGLKPAHEPITVARKPGKSKLNIDLCRVVRPSGDRVEYGVDGDECSPTNNTYGYRARVAYKPDEAGRYPANLVHDGSEVVTAMFPDNNPGCKPHRVKASEETVERLQSKGWGFAGCDKIAGYDDGDDLSAARFFYCAKANKKDRGEGNDHPTVKPTDLMRYLCRLVTPAGGLVLDPFMGSGSTGKAALLEGYDFIGIECRAEYVALAHRRIAEVVAHE